MKLEHLNMITLWSNTSNTVRARLIHLLDYLMMRYLVVQSMELMTAQFYLMIMRTGYGLEKKLLVHLILVRETGGT